MLQKLNERIQGVVAWVIIILVAITFTLFGVDYYLQSRHSSSAKVKVNGQEISKQDFDVHYRRNVQFRDPEKTNFISESQFEQQILNDMIVRTLSVQAAHNNGFLVNKEQANSVIVSIPQFQEKGHFSNSRYAQALSGALYTTESFQKEVQDGMLTNQQRFALIGTEFVLPHEIERFVKLYMQKRDYSYLQIPVARFLHEAKISDADIQSYYNQHKNEYFSKEKVSIDFIRVSMQDVKKHVTITDEQLQQYYDENRHNYLTPARWRVARILLQFPKNASDEEIAQLKSKAYSLYDELQINPDKFNEKIKNFSADKNSQNGILPWVVAGSSTYDKYFVSFTEKNQILHPIKTASGYEIFKLIEYVAASTKSFAEVKPIIKEQLLADIAQNKYTDLLEKLSDLSYQTPDSLDLVAKSLNLNVEHSELFDKNGGTGVVDKNSKVIQAAFSADVLESGNNSELIQLDNESVVVLRVNKRILAYAIALKDLKDSIRTKLTFIKAKEIAKNFGEKLLSSQDISSKNNFQEISKYNLKWKNIIQAGRDLNNIDTTINELAFSLSSRGKKSGITLTNGDFVVVYLSKIYDGDVNSLDKEQLSSFTQQIESSYGLLDYNLYINSLMKQANILRS